MFDADCLSPAISQSKTTALLLIVFFGLASVHFLDPGAGLVAFVILFSLFAIGIAVSSIAIKGVLSRFNLVKSQELQNVRDHLKREQTHILNEKVTSKETIESLLLLEKRLEESHLGLMQLSSLARYVIYALLGILSWLGAAMVERILDMALG